MYGAKALPPSPANLQRHGVTGAYALLRDRVRPLTIAIPVVQVIIDNVVELGCLQHGCGGRCERSRKRADIPPPHVRALAELEEKSKFLYTLGMVSCAYRNGPRANPTWIPCTSTRGCEGYALTSGPARKLGSYPINGDLPSCNHHGPWHTWRSWPA